MNIEEFKTELSKININITNEQLKQLEKYYELLIEWNEKINLTRITKKEDVYLKHFYDSATINKVIDLNKIETLCDFGTGAGFPGLVIKILFPNIDITLVDSLNKRITFLNEVITKLGLKKITAIHSRIEDFGKIHREKYDLVTARAVAPLNILLEYAIPMVKVNKYFLAMKANIDEELKLSENASKKMKAELIEKHEFNLPYEESIRSLLLYKKTEKTEKKYPRIPNEINKRPL